MSDVGTFFPVAGLNFTFNDTATTSMPSGSMLMSGTFAPTNFDPVGDVDGFPAPAPLVGVSILWMTWPGTMASSRVAGR